MWVFLDNIERNAYNIVVCLSVHNIFGTGLIKNIGNCIIMRYYNIVSLFSEAGPYFRVVLLSNSSIFEPPFCN